MSDSTSSTRVRGLASWNPHTVTRERLEDVEAVFEEYAEHRPLTIRQVLYRLAAQYEGWTKDDYNRVQEMLNRARRSGWIPFEWIRDDEVLERRWCGFDGVPGFWDSTVNRAHGYQRRRQEGQPQVLEIWVEATGMIPQVARVAKRYHIPVRSRGGFESLTVKHKAAQRYAYRDRPTVVLEIGDHDPSGVARLNALTEDIKQMVADLPGGAGPDWVQFERVAVTPDQIEEYDLPVKDPNPRDRRGVWPGGPAVQAEALAPDDLASEIQESVKVCINQEVFRGLLDQEQEQRSEIVARARALANGDST